MTDAVRLKTRSAARRVSLSAVICALSVITPQIFHLVGGQVAGNAFLPMHIPVLLGGFLLPPGAAMVCGALSPVLSFFLTGMPAMPRLIFMVLELGAYGFFCFAVCAQTSITDLFKRCAFHALRQSGLFCKRCRGASCFSFADSRHDLRRGGGLGGGKHWRSRHSFTVGFDSGLGGRIKKGRFDSP